MQYVSVRRHDQSWAPLDPLAILESLANLTRYHSQQEIYDRNDPVLYRYRLVSGAARKFTTQPDGRRQIVDLLLPGDLFGFAQLHEHSFTVEATVDDTLVARYPRARIDALSESDLRFGRLIRELTAAEISRLQARILLLGRMTTREKINGFLLEMAERLPNGSDRIVLPMSRYDVADYLAVSVETVSRAFTALKRRGTIKFTGTRQMLIVDRTALDDGSDDHHRWHS
jgi:CRP/FNR family transcriptional regulator, nitrogen fixation regulation protein